MFKDRYKTVLASAIVIFISTTGPATSMGWMNLSHAYIHHLDGDTYRFRAAFEWGGETYIDPGSKYVVDPVLDHLMIGNPLGEPVDWTYNHTGAMGYSDPGRWFGGYTPFTGAGGASGLTGPEFGWDFIYDGQDNVVFSMSYRGVMAWREFDSRSKQIYGDAPGLRHSSSGLCHYFIIPWLQLGNPAMLRA